MSIAPHTTHRTGPGSNVSQAAFREREGEGARDGERRYREEDTMPATPYSALVDAHNAARACALASSGWRGWRSRRASVVHFLVQNTRNQIVRLVFVFRVIARAVARAFDGLRRF